MTKKQIIWCLIGIMLLATFFRFWKIDSAPPGVYPDEAMNATNAIEVMNTGNYKVFYPDNFGREGLYINLIAFSFKTFGVNIWSFRLVSAIFGILTVLGLYLLTKELFDDKTGLIASFFLAISFWHINFSRIAFRAIMVPFCIVFGFYFLFKAFRRNNNLLDLVFSAIFFGVGFNTYIAFRVVPAIILTVLIFYFLQKYKDKIKKSSKNKWKDFFSQLFIQDGWWKFTIFIIVAILVMLPLLVHFYKIPVDFSGRTSEVSVLKAKEGPILALAKNTIITLSMFNIWGDGNWRHNYAHWPMLAIPVGILFLIGITLTIKSLWDKIKQKKIPELKYIFLITWFLVMLSPAILSNEGLPHALRTIGVIPVAYIFASIGFLWFISLLTTLDLSIFFIEKQKNLTTLQINTVIITFFLILIPCAYYKYFYQWAKNPKTAVAFTKYLADIGNNIKNSPANYLKFVIIQHPLPDQVIRFTSYGTENVIYLYQNEQEKLHELIRDFAKANTKKGNGKDRISIYTTEHSNQFFLDLLDKYPDGMIEKDKKEGDFWIFRLYR